MAKTAQRMVIFFVLACGFSWASLALLSGAGRIMGQVFYMFGPLFAALICMALFRQKAWQSVLGLRLCAWPYLAFGWALVIAILLASGALMLWLRLGVYVGFADGLKLLADNGEAKAPNLGFLLLIGLLIGPLLYAMPALLAELGWRGWVWCETQALGFWLASFLNGVLWGVWQMPLYYIGFGMGAALLVFALSVISAPLFCLMRAQSRTVLVPALMQGVVLAFVPLSLLPIAGATPIVAAYCSLFILGLVLIFVWWWTESRDLPEI